MEPIVVIALAGMLVAALLGGQPPVPPQPRIIVVSSPSALPAEGGCLPLLALGLLILLVLAAAQT